MARRRKPPKDDFIAKLEKAILAMLEPEQKVGIPPVELTPEAKIQLINAGTRLATARFKISGDDEEGGYFSK